MKKQKSLIQLIAILTAVGCITLYILLYYDGQSRYYRLYYFLPVTIPGVLFVFDRLSRLDQLGTTLPFIDTIITIIALIRAIWPIPFYSGHALFLSFLLIKRNIFQYC